MINTVSDISNLSTNINDWLERILSESSPRTRWGPAGFDNPRIGWWKTQDGREILYSEMEDSHVINAIKHLDKLFEEECKEWYCYTCLRYECMRRGINGYKRKDWDD